MNFDAVLSKEFGEYYALRESLTVPLQTVSLRSAAQTEALRRFQGAHYDDLRKFLDVYRGGLAGEIYENPEYSFRVYLVPKQGNHRTSSDIAFEFARYDPTRPDEMEAHRKCVALIKDRQIPVVNAGMLRPKQVAEQVALRIGKAFSVHNHTQAYRHYEVRVRGQFPEKCNPTYCHFDAAHRDYVYTAEWVEFLAGKLCDAVEYQRVLAYKARPVGGHGHGANHNRWHRSVTSP